ncbi:hypothetical protein [Halomontanus rarus]|uniref:hypothetical protein n=1 Tax=Halomontanus rarus TaxID=3034020 RepID=UPI001A99B4EB|nr:hypothetical protein [Halovivax sp. TS33]
MSQSNHSQLYVGCPHCDATVSASVPTGTRTEELDWNDPNRLQGKETRCENCDHELEFYYY